MNNRITLIFSSTAIVFLSLVVLIINHSINQIHFVEGSWVTFYYADFYGALAIRGLYHVGILTGLIVGIVLALSLNILKKLGVLDWISIYTKNMEKKYWKAGFLVVLTWFVYMCFISVDLFIAILRIGHTMDDLVYDILYLSWNIIILLVSVPVLLYFRKKAFRKEGV